MHTIAKLLYSRIMTSIDAITTFARIHNADLTIMEDGEDWFHTEEQMRFLDDWIKEKWLISSQVSG